MKNMGKVAVLLLMMVLASSCMVRFDRKQAVAMLEKAKESEIAPSRVYVLRDTAVSQFSRLDIACGADIEFIQDNAGPHVQIFGSDNIVPMIDVSVEDGALAVRWGELMRGRSAWLAAEDIKITVYAASLSSLNMKGSGDFTCTRIEVPDMQFDMSLSGSSDVRFGMLMSKSLTISLKGSADLDFKNISTGDIALKVAGSGDVDLGTVRAGSVGVSVAGSGHVELAGEAECASYSIAGSGDIDAAGLRCTSASASVRGSGTLKYQDSDGKVKTKED